MGILKLESAGTLLKDIKGDLLAFFKWTALAVLSGAGIGLAGVGLLFCVQKATELRFQNSWLVWLLPAAGVLTVFIYRICGVNRSQGTNLVLSAVRSPDPVPLRMAPLIFVGTTITHLFGGSAGREGAALQIGGSLGFQTGRLFRLDEKDLHIMTMCGMSAAFSALFGTPAAAVVFAMEVVSVGVMYYAALVPCTIASLIAVSIARVLGFSRPVYSVAFPVLHSIPAGLRTVALAALCAGLSALFCFVLKGTGRLYEKYLKNGYLIAAVGGILIVALTLIFNTRDYLGIGEKIIDAALGGQARPEAFVLKMVFTALTLGAGFKGGEIVPSFFVGATFGCTAGGLLGLDPAVGGAFGMIAVFAGVTNCPLTAFIIGIELFGTQGLPFYLLAAAVSYMLSGYTGLYGSQQILYSKTRAEFIGKPSGK